MIPPRNLLFVRSSISFYLHLIALSDALYWIIKGEVHGLRIPLLSLYNPYDNYIIVLGQLILFFR